MIEITNTPTFEVIMPAPIEIEVYLGTPILQMKNKEKNRLLAQLYDQLDRAAWLPITLDPSLIKECEKQVSIATSLAKDEPLDLEKADIFLAKTWNTAIKIKERVIRKTKEMKEITQTIAKIATEITANSHHVAAAKALAIAKTRGMVLVCTQRVNSSEVNTWKNILAEANGVRNSLEMDYTALQFLSESTLHEIFGVRQNLDILNFPEIKIIASTLMNTQEKVSASFQGAENFISSLRSIFSPGFRF
jgi:hypothetical protein